MVLGADQTNQPTTWCLLNTTISYILERTCRMSSQFLLLSLRMALTLLCVDFLDFLGAGIDFFLDCPQLLDDASNIQTRARF